MKKYLIWIPIGFIILTLLNLYIFTLVFFYHHSTTFWKLFTLESGISVVFGVVISAIIFFTKDCLENGW